MSYNYIKEEKVRTEIGVYPHYQIQEMQILNSNFGQTAKRKGYI